jgi:aspartate/methionine/tyrosine aminotransferase
MRPARRVEQVRPFHAMEILARSQALEARGVDVVHMEVGEPDFPTPEPILQAGHGALTAGRTRYTAATGLPALREAIAGHYEARHGLRVSPARVVVTPGASGALSLLLSALVDPGDEVLVPDPGYPCNRSFVHLAGGRPVPIAVDAAQGWNPAPEQVRDLINGWTRVLMLASPSNPTGAVLSARELADLRALTWPEGIQLVVDEIYQGLVYEGDAPTALALGEDPFVVNSFSKYYGMTGWRLGWLVAPEHLIPELDRLAQNLFLSAPAPAQHAALAAFTPEVEEIVEQRVAAFRERRDFLVPALRDMGFGVPATPAGAFYVYADCSRFTDDSFGLAMEILHHTGVAVTPGRDFGDHLPERHLRFAYTTSLERLEVGAERLAAFLS